MEIVPANAPAPSARRYTPADCSAATAICQEAPEIFERSFTIAPSVSVRSVRSKVTEADSALRTGKLSLRLNPPPRTIFPSSVIVPEYTLFPDSVTSAPDSTARSRKYTMPPRAAESIERETEPPEETAVLLKISDAFSLLEVSWMRCRPPDSTVVSTTRVSTEELALPMEIICTPREPTVVAVARAPLATF